MRPSLNRGGGGSRSKMAKDKEYRTEFENKTQNEDVTREVGGES